MKNYVTRITPNEDQAKALEAMKKFLKDKTAKEFCLMGPGGTGKTTIVRELFIKKDKKTDLDYVNANTCGVCVSHKARLVLQNSISNSITYASAVNLTIAFDEFGEMIFVPKNNSGTYRLSNINQYKNIVFDEASMIGPEMREIIHRSCRPDAKIIYMGDECQLPPIKPAKGSYDADADSPVFSLPNQYKLTQKVRQVEGDPIAMLCDETRSHIYGDLSLSWMNNIKAQYNPEVNKGYSLTKESSVIKSFIKNYNEGKDVKILAYRNKRVDDLNYKIRNILFPNGHEKTYVPGDLVVGNNQYKPNDDVIFYNGQDMIVESVEIASLRDIECYRLYMKDISSPVYVPTEKGSIEYNKMVAKLKGYAQRSKFWGEYMEYISSFADISYGYAITLYKIQGSTLYGVYVDVHDIYGVKPLTPKRKLQSLYTGFSRATNTLALF